MTFAAPGKDDDPGKALSHEEWPAGVVCCAYSDGNGLWITSCDSPCDLGFFRQSHPQD